MARFLTGLVAGMAIATIAGAALGVHSQADDVAVAAAAAGVDERDLRGALNSQAAHGLTSDPWSYLRSNRELPPLPPPVAASPAAPASGAYSARVECIISKESGGANVANRRGSGAVGVAQYMPSTFAAHAREMGHPEWSPWNPEQARAVAAHDLALGRRAQWTVGGC